MKHQEVAWVPMCTPEKGEPWFWVAGIRDLQRDARSNFVEHCRADWKALRKEGWRIVLVKLTTEIH
jgi:hypothetical protein